MASWRDEAYRRFPELKEAFDRRDSMYQFWNELQLAFEDAYDRDNHDLVKRIYQYARWCCEQPPGDTAANDLGSCVATTFFEHIPQHPKALADMPRWWKLDEVKTMKAIFSYMVGEKGYAKVLEQFK